MKLVSGLDDILELVGGTVLVLDVVVGRLPSKNINYTITYLFLHHITACNFSYFCLDMHLCEELCG